MTENRAPYNLALVRDALGQAGIDEGLKVAQGARIGSRQVPAGEGDLWLENSIRFSTCLAGGLSVSAWTVSASLATWEPIEFDTEEFDTDAMGDLATYPTRLTINSDGMYQIHGYFLFAAAAAGTRAIAILLNGTTVLSAWSNNGVDYAINVFCDALWWLNEMDYLELCAYHDLGATVDISDVLFSAARVP